MRTIYFNILNISGDIVDKKIETFLSQDVFGKAKKIIYEPMLHRKIGKQKLRAALVLILYKLFSGKDIDEETPEAIKNFMTAVELSIYSEYQANWIFDNKGLVRKDPLIRKKAAVASKSFLEDAVRFANLGKEGASDIILNTSQNVTLSFVYELEMDMTNRSNFDISWEEYEKKYLKEYAVYGIGETFAHALDLVTEYLPKFKKQKKVADLRSLILEYGAYHEMLNDLGDFSLEVQTTDKAPIDQFSDIRNGAITPIIWLMFKNSNDIQRDFLYSCYGKESLSNEEKNILISILKETNTLDFISKKIKSKSRDLQKRFKRLNFNKNDGQKLFQMFLSVLESNKIFNSF